MAEKNSKNNEKGSLSDGADESSGVMKKELANKTLMVVALRNKFFFLLYRNVLMVFLASLVGLGFAIALTLFFAGHPVYPRYIAINEDGSYINLLPVSECKSDAEVQNFVVSATKRLFRYDHINYSDQLQDAAYYFTLPGWNAFLTSYGSSKTLDAVKENRWVVTVNINSVPQINKQNVIDGVCTWELTLPVNVMYMGNKSQSVNLNLYYKVQRQSIVQHPEGLGITNLIQQQLR